jgi:ABC-type polysaccharide/polyol phosphate transport system ATPase subunit
VAVITVEGVTKEFRLGAMQGLVSMAGSLLGRGTRTPPFKALDDVSFSVEAGEVVGLIGSNGAGKSTLLKLLSNISKPTRGRVKVQGRVAPLIEVGAGLVGDLTGRENVYLNGAILGISKAEIDRKFDEIVAFAEIERFIDTPLKRYSSGMQVRLGFAVATSVESDILIVDEVLAVGDVAFQRKCLDRMEDIIRHHDRTVFVVSHNIRQLERFCSRVILLERGKLVMDGSATDVCTEFFSRSNAVIKANLAHQPMDRMASDEIELLSMHFDGPGARTASSVTFGKTCQFHVSLRARKPLKDMHLLIAFHTTDFVYLTQYFNYGDMMDLEARQYDMVLDLPRMALYAGVYQVRVWVGNHIGRESFSGDGLFAFDVVSEDYFPARQGGEALFDMPGKLNISASGNTPALAPGSLAEGAWVRHPAVEAGR